jgi:hypothetical protein
MLEIQQEIIHNQSPRRAQQGRSLDLAGPEPISIEYAVLRKHFGSRVHVLQSLEDGVESYVDELCIGFLGRVGHTRDLVGFTAIFYLFRPQRLRVQAQASRMVSANVPIPLRTTESMT